MYDEDYARYQSQARAEESIEEFSRRTVREREAYVTKDSGEKAVHSDGVQRDTQAGKTKFTLMFPRGVPMKDQLIVRIAELYTRGGEKYGDRNWENSCAPDTLDHHLEALWRHFMSFFFEENQEEDHAAAVIWNINAVELTRRNIREATPKQLTEAEVPNNVPPETKLSQEAELLPLLALKDDTGDYWQAEDDGTFSCWFEGMPSSPLTAWGRDEVARDWGPLTEIWESPEEGFPWD